MVVDGRSRMGQTLYVPMPDGSIEVEVTGTVFFDEKGERLQAAFPAATGQACPLAEKGRIGAVLTAVYFVKVLRQVCQGEPTPAVQPTGQQTGSPAATPGASTGLATAVRAEEATSLELGVWAPLVMLTVVIGLVPGVLLDVVDPAVRALLGGGA